MLKPAEEAPRTYVLDTSVLLADPGALKRFHEHEVVLPVVVITELEAKRAHPELGFFARSALRQLDELRVLHGRLDSAVSIGDVGGTVRVELNSTDPMVLPAGFRLGDNDSRILAVALNLRAGGADVTLVSKDLPMRVKAAAVGLAAEEYRAELAVETGYTGMSEAVVSADIVDDLYAGDVVDLQQARDLPCHCGVRLLSDRGSALGRVTADKQVRLVRGDRDAFGIRGRSAEQRVALELLLDPEIGIVSLGGAPAPASPRWRCVPGSKPSWSDGSTRRWWSSVRCTPSAAKTSDISPATSRRRCSPGPKLSSTRWEL